MTVELSIGIIQEINGYLEGKKVEARFRVPSLDSPKQYSVNPVPKDLNEWQRVHEALAHALSKVKGGGEKFHVEKWVDRKSFRAQCPVCGGERTFQHMLSPAKERYVWVCNTDNFHAHTVSVEDLDGEHPDWKNRPIQK